MFVLPDMLRGLALRYKLLALVLIPLVLLAVTVIYMTARWSTSYTYEQLYTKVNTDLRVTHDIFQRIQLDRQESLSTLASSSTFLARLQFGEPSGVFTLLKRQRDKADFDFINLLSADGKQRLLADRWQPWPVRSSPLTDEMFGSRSDAVLANKATGIEIYQREDWEREEQVQSDKVVFPLIDTPFATPSDRTEEDRAMVIRVLKRVTGTNGKVLGVLEGGLLLNRNYDFVDEIRDLVYGPGSLAEGSLGTVTVFLDDVRITTNVPSSDDTRALGTRVSSEVRHAVLSQGTPWIDRAFVVNDWYISAYEPIVDVNGKRVGMLYAGYLEAPFRNELNKAIAVLAAVVLGGSLLAVVAVTLGAKSIFKPVEEIARVVRATAAGEHKRIGSINSHDEIGELAVQFDSMLDKLELHRAQLQAGAHELEHKVRLRTAELESKNTSLQESIDLLHKTRQQLATAEKLAAVGELTAGVAHEINNPTAVILGNMDILIQELGSQRQDVQTEIDLVIEQVYRIRSITDRLLQYSRPSSTTPLESGAIGNDAALANYEFEDLDELLSPDYNVDVDINELISDSVVLVKTELDAANIKLQQSLADIPAINIDRTELQQVLVNLLLNAIQASSTGGTISITTSLLPDALRISIRDNGVGIAPEHLPRVFDPFFTTGKAGGTGLGLSVSYGIVNKHNGHIDVESEQGHGAVFHVVLPVDSISKNHEMGLDSTSTASPAMRHGVDALVDS